MSVVDKELLYDEAIQALGDDRIGLAARLAYIAALANSHVTASDGTLPFSPTVVRLRLLPGVTLSVQEAAEVAQRIVEKELFVLYEAGGKQYAVVPAWWKYNSRPNKATRAAKNPEIPPEVLRRVPQFASTYSGILTTSEQRAHRSEKSRNNRAKAKKPGTSVPEPEPESVTAPEPVAAPVPLPALATAPAPAGGDFELTRVVLPVVVAFERTYLATFSADHPTTEGEQRDVLALWETLDPPEQDGLEGDVSVYFESTLEPTLDGFCEWRRERARRGRTRSVAVGVVR